MIGLKQFWLWLLLTDGGLTLRIAIGVAIFAGLALWDLYRNGRRATRWREYLVLVGCVAAAMTYGILNDLITSSISWEYFYFGKELAAELGPRTPPEPEKLRIAAAVIGMKATWTAGLVIGVALLLANNPSRKLPRLSYRSLAGMLPMIFLITALLACFGGALGYYRVPASFSDDFSMLAQQDLWRPSRFMAVYGIHLGGYVGAGLGLIIALARIRKLRKQVVNTAPPPAVAIARDPAA